MQIIKSIYETAFLLCSVFFAICRAFVSMLLMTAAGTFGLAAAIVSKDVVKALVKSVYEVHLKDPELWGNCIEWAHDKD